MTLKSSRSSEQMKEVMMDPNVTSGPDPVYEVFNELGNPMWENQTVIYPRKLGQEFPKTYGHYHGTAINETYTVISGTGVMVLQNRDLTKILFVSAQPGDQIIITPKWGHSWSNIGSEPLVTRDDWRSGHQDSDYEFQKAHHGMAYYLIEENGEIKAVPNPNYQNLPAPIWLTAAEFSNQKAVNL
jgi:glucose-6-phosphate isomerase